MKIAISVPDVIFHEAELLASALNKSRSQLYAEALAGFVRSHSAYDITRRINAICERELFMGVASKIDLATQQTIAPYLEVSKAADPTALEPAFAAAQFRMLNRAAW